MTRLRRRTHASSRSARRRRTGSRTGSSTECGQGSPTFLSSCADLMGAQRSASHQPATAEEDLPPGPVWSQRASAGQGRRPRQRRRRLALRGRPSHLFQLLVVRRAPRPLDRAQRQCRRTRCHTLLRQHHTARLQRALGLQLAQLLRKEAPVPLHHRGAARRQSPVQVVRRRRFLGMLTQARSQVCATSCHLCMCSTCNPVPARLPNRLARRDFR